MIIADRRYQVFVSSTFQDLQEERREVMTALLELKCIPSGMELFPAANEDQWSLIKKVIDDCDYYIVIVGGRYGSVHPKTGISYTEMEYQYALKQRKPILGFVHSDPMKLAGERIERTSQATKKLGKFRELVQRKTVKFWSTPADLGSVVSRSMTALTSNTPAPGWIRADAAVDEVSERTMREIDGLRKQVGELMIHTKVSEAIVRTGLHQVGFNATEIPWDELFKAREIDLFFVYARTWRTNNTANLQECARRPGTHIRVVLPDPSSEVILEELANRMLKTPENFRQWIEEACAEFLKLQRVARKHGAEVSIWLASVTPIYSLYRFDDRAVLALNSYQRHRGNVPHFLANKDGALYRFVVDEFRILLQQEDPPALTRTYSQ